MLITGNIWFFFFGGGVTGFLINIDLILIFNLNSHKNMLFVKLSDFVPEACSIAKTHISQIQHSRCYSICSVNKKTID